MKNTLEATNNSNTHQWVVFTHQDLFSNYLYDGLPGSDSSLLDSKDLYPHFFERDKFAKDAEGIIYSEGVPGQFIIWDGDRYERQLMHFLLVKEENDNDNEFYTAYGTPKNDVIKIDDDYSDDDYIMWGRDMGDLFMNQNDGDKKRFLIIKDFKDSGDRISLITKHKEDGLFTTYEYSEYGGVYWDSSNDRAVIKRQTCDNKDLDNDCTGWFEEVYVEGVRAGLFDNNPDALDSDNNLVNYREKK